MQVTYVPRVSQCAEMTRIASGRDKYFPRALICFVKSFSDTIFIGEPWPINIAGSCLFILYFSWITVFTGMIKPMIFVIFFLQVEFKPHCHHQIKLSLTVWVLQMITTHNPQMRMAYMEERWCWLPEKGNT